jgi:hypothetical protein
MQLSTLPAKVEACLTEAKVHATSMPQATTFKQQASEVCKEIP